MQNRGDRPLGHRNFSLEQRGQTPRTHGLKKVIRKNVKKYSTIFNFFKLWHFFGQN